MRTGDPCPRCSDDVTLVDPTEDIWSLDPSEYDDAEVWLCVACGWNEEAEVDDVIEEHADTLDWVAARLGADSHV